MLSLKFIHRSIFITALTFLLMFLQGAVYAQTKSRVINGKVTSFDGSLALEGVHIVVKGTRNETGTQSDGTFSLSVTPSDSVLVVSYPDYEPKFITLSQAPEYDIILKLKDHLTEFTRSCGRVARQGSATSFTTVQLRP